jgi:DNA invertase Pin-like site-specific DNA recombinase
MDNILNLLRERGITELYAYSRKSREIDEETLTKHNDIIRATARKLGMPVFFYSEVDSSEHLNRPELNRLRKDISAKKVRALIVYRLDRLSRKVTDTERLLKEFSFKDVILIEAHKEKMVDFSELIGLKLEAMMSDLYLEHAKMILSAGKQQAVALYGNHIGQAPFGYTYDRGTKKLVPNADAEMVRQIFQWYIDGFSVTQITEKLVKLGWKNSRGRAFSNKKAVHVMLTNEKYIGTQIYGKTEWMKDANGKKLSKPRPKSEWIVYENAHEPIVDMDTFNKVQGLLVTNRRTPVGARNRKYALTNLVECGCCGWKMNIFTKHKVAGDELAIRSCYTVNYEEGRKRCGNRAPAHDIMEDYLREQIWEVVRPVVLKAKKEMAKGMKIKLNKNQDLAQLERQAKDLTKQIDNVIDMQLDMGKTERLMVKMKQLEAQLDLVNESIDKIKRGSTDEDDLKWVEHFLNSAEDLVGFPLNYKGWTQEERNRFLKRYIEKVVVKDEQVIEIVYTDEVNSLIQH